MQPPLQPAGRPGRPRGKLTALTGGAIGQGLPSSIGAAIACPDRPVLALIGDGTAMYTIQALWTMAREKLDITAVIFNNASYSVRRVELERVGAERSGPKARAAGPERPGDRLLPAGAGHGRARPRADSAEDFCRALEYALAHPGPHLIEAVVPESLSAAKRRVLPWVLGSLPKLPAPLARALKRKLAP